MAIASDGSSLAYDAWIVSGLPRGGIASDSPIDCNSLPLDLLEMVPLLLSLVKRIFLLSGQDRKI